MRIPILTETIYFYRIFFRYIGYRLPLFIFLSFATSVIAGLGFIAFIPLLDFNAATTVTRSSYSKFVYDILGSVGLEASLFSILGLMVFVFLLKSVLLFGQTSFRISTATRVSQYLQTHLSSTFTTVSYAYYTKSNIGYMTNLITAEVARTVACFKQYCRMLVAATAAIVYLVYSTCLNWEVTVFALGVGLILAWPMWRVAKSISRLSTKVTEKNIESQTLLLQLVTNFKYLKATANFNKIVAPLSRAIKAQRRYNLYSSSLAMLPKLIVEPLTILVLSLFLLYVIGQRGESLLDNLLTLFFLDHAIRSILLVQSTHQQFAQRLGGLEVLETTRASISSQLEDTTGRQIEGFKHEIRLTEVGFDYGDKTILDQISFDIPRGKSIGIVGESGAGKTTLFDLLTRLHDPARGTIQIDGVDYQSIAKPDLRSLFGYVTQEPVIFDGTIRDNITLWSAQDDCDHRLRQAAVMAGCIEFIESTAHGFATQIGDRGIRLSGGQQQRLAIARELFWNPEILILDEATSSLDNEAESIIQQSIRKLHGTITIVIIAHRLATVKDCDTIVVLKQGRLIETGSWDELTADQESCFYQLCRKQLLC